MAAIVSAADANREFSKLLRRVREGQSVTITSHGRPIAKLVPIDADARLREAARKALFKRLRTQKGTRIGPITWTRKELHERDGEEA
jgi:prevent-host-death family protein